MQMGQIKSTVMLFSREKCEACNKVGLSFYFHHFQFRKRKMVHKVVAANKLSAYG